MRDKIMAADINRLLDGRRGHFRLESGYHGEVWYRLDSLFEQPDALRPFVAELARRLARHGVAAVCGPETGGARLARLIAEELGVEPASSERSLAPDATGLFPVQYAVAAGMRDVLRGKTVAIVDDAVSAGSAVRGTFADLVTCGARPVALAALFVFGDRAALFAADNDLTLECIARQPYHLWPPEDCPLCRARIPLEDISNLP
jgi:orotate phosphoribosyltransferase